MALSAFPQSNHAALSTDRALFDFEVLLQTPRVTFKTFYCPFCRNAYIHALFFMIPLVFSIIVSETMTQNPDLVLRNVPLFFLLFVRIPKTLLEFRTDYLNCPCTKSCILILFVTHLCAY